MAKNAATHIPTALAPAGQPASSPRSLAPVIDINVRHIGRKPQPQTLIGATAPEGWIKKIDRPREGKVWVGYFHLYVADSFGRPVRKKKEKTLGPATMPKHEAQRKLVDYIEEFTGKLIRQGDAIERFADLWKAFSAVKAGSWRSFLTEYSEVVKDCLLEAKADGTRYVTRVTATAGGASTIREELRRPSQAVPEASAVEPNGFHRMGKGSCRGRPHSRGSRL